MESVSIPIILILFRDQIQRLKKSLGGKGVGRLSWLKAFNAVSISSVFNEDGKCYHRSFDFSVNEGIENEVCNVINEEKQSTTITLSRFFQNYANHCPKNLSTICRKIAEHCLEYFILDGCAKISVTDINNDSRCVNTIVEDEIIKHSDDSSFLINGHKFNVRNLRIYTSQDNQHRLLYCAHNRVVTVEHLKGKVPHLERRIPDGESRSFVYNGYVSSSYLDESVNAERTDFLIEHTNELSLTDVITWGDMNKIIFENVKEYLSPYTARVSKDKMERVKKFVYNEAPQFRPVLKYKPEAVESIPIDLADERLDIELQKVMNAINIELKEKAHHFLHTDIESIPDLFKFKKELDAFIEKENEIGKAELSRYITHRMMILKFLDKALQRRSNGRYQLEETVHQIVFPLRTTSDEIDYENQNLWIIDEKLAYHSYLASDVSLRGMDISQSTDADRPDIIIFDRPFAFVEGDQPFSSIVIIEFKRPQREDYDDDENPISQVCRYITKIEGGTDTDRLGRPFNVGKDTRYYCYIIADLTPKMHNYAKLGSLQLAPDNMGYFGYNPNYRAYIEVISYEKLKNDAKKRNRVLFDKLNLQW